MQAKGAKGESVEQGTVSASALQVTFYRQREANIIIQSLKAAESLLILGDTGSGKSFLAAQVQSQLQKEGYLCVLVTQDVPKAQILSITSCLGIPDTNIEGEKLNIPQLQNEVLIALEETSCFLLFDDAHRLTPLMRYWLERLHSQGQPMALFANNPPAEGIFLRLPRFTLQPLPPKAVKQIILATAQQLNYQLSNAQVSQMLAYCGGSPLLAQRVVKESYLKIEPEGPDHHQQIDITPFLVALLMLTGTVRIIGIGLNRTSLYIIGGICLIFVGIIRYLVYRLPLKNSRKRIL